MSAGLIFNTLVEVIAADPRTVWELFLDRSRWMKAFIAEDVIAGAPGQNGYLAQVHTRGGLAGAARMEEVIHAEPGRRLVVRLSAEGTDAAGHADFQFEPCSRGCRLQVSIHTFAPGLDAGQARELERATQQKIAADFSALRSLAESVPPAA